MRKISFIFVILILAQIILAYNQSDTNYQCIIRNKYGNVNWTLHYFESKGFARLDKNMKNIASNELITLKKATDIGIKNLFNLLSYQFYDSKNLIIDKIKENPKLTYNLYQYIHKARKSNIIYKKDLREINFLLPFVIDQENSVYKYLNLKRDYYIKITYQSEFIHKTKFTGLVIDARGLNLKPGIMMKILNQNRELFFYFDNVKWNYIQKFGYITYISDPSGLKYLTKIIGKHPYKLAALEAFGINNTDLIISNEDIDLLLGNPDNLRIFYEGRIVVIVDKK